MQTCPVCGGPQWDNRQNKKNPKGPDFTCKDKTCKWKQEKGSDEWVPSDYPTGVWVPKTRQPVKSYPAGTPMVPAPNGGDGFVKAPPDFLTPSKPTSITPKPKLGDVVTRTQESEADMWKRKGEQMNRSNLAAAVLQSQGQGVDWALLEQMEAWVLTGKTPPQLAEQSLDDNFPPESD